MLDVVSLMMKKALSMEITNTAQNLYMHQTKKTYENRIHTFQHKSTLKYKSTLFFFLIFEPTSLKAVLLFGIECVGCQNFV